MTTGRGLLVAVLMAPALLVGVSIAPGLARGGPAGVPAKASRGHTSYFAGRSYPEAGSGRATTEFLVPQLTCTSTNTGVAAGAFMYTTDTSAQQSSRTLLSAASVQLFCLRGEPAPLPVVELQGRQTYGQRRPHIGDLMRATVIDSASRLSVTLQDLTEDHAFTLSRAEFAAPATAAAIGDEALRGVPSLTPGPMYPITDFGSISFVASRVNGKAIGVAGGRAIDMVTRRGVLQVRTGRPTGRGPRRSRTAFTTRWKHP